MKTVDENILALMLVESEGGVKSISIGQVREVQKLLLDALAYEWTRGNAAGVVELIEKHARSDD